MLRVMINKFKTKKHIILEKCKGDDLNSLIRELDYYSNISNLYTSDVFNPLVLATTYNKHHIVKYLLDKGLGDAPFIDFLKQDIYLNCIKIGIELKNINPVKEIVLKCLEDVSTGVHARLNILTMYAAYYGNADIFNFLLNIYIKTNDHENEYFLNNLKKIVNSAFNPIYLKDSRKLLKNLFKNEFITKNITFDKKELNKILINACKNSNYEIVTLLLENSLFENHKYNFESDSITFYSAFLAAIKSKHYALICLMSDIIIPNGLKDWLFIANNVKILMNNLNVNERLFAYEVIAKNRSRNILKMTKLATYLLEKNLPIEIVDYIINLSFNDVINEERNGLYSYKCLLCNNVKLNPILKLFEYMDFEDLNKAQGYTKRDIENAIRYAQNINNNRNLLLSKFETLDTQKANNAAITIQTKWQSYKAKKTDYLVKSYEDQNFDIDKNSIPMEIFKIK